MSPHSGRIPSTSGRRLADPKLFRERLTRVLGDTVAPASIYQGLPADPEATEVMLSHLATRMRYGAYPWPGGAAVWATEDNANIPAGYTYLAQLLAHDMVQNTSQLPLIAEFPGPMQRDYRVQRLVLDTIYGGGPARDPLPYGIAMNGLADRCLLRLGHVRAQEPQPFDHDPPPPLVDQPARDIPRAHCPHLSDQPSAKVTPDALLADSRNDQHLLISQLTALFHELHNIVFHKVRVLQDEAPPALAEVLNLAVRADHVSDAAFRLAQDDMAFLQTRKVVAYLFRRIVIADLLPRLIEPGVLAYYTDPARRFPTDLLQQQQSSAVPVEFSHAAFRFGHVMARFSYKLNNKLDPNPSIKSLLDRSSARRRDLLPLASDWLVDWSHFFDLGDGTTVNASRRISPFVAFGPLAGDSIVPPGKDRDGGLFYRDLLRGYEAGVTRVDALIGVLRRSDVDRSDILKDANLREHEIGKWLTFAPDVGFTPDELVSLSKDPPLLFFIMFEAAFTQAGLRLGILGSTLVADAVFAALNANRAVIEDDPAVPVLVDQCFGPNPPSSMPAAIAYVKANGGLADVVLTA